MSYLRHEKEGRVTKETSQQLRVARQAPALAGHRGLDSAGRVRGEVRQAAVLEIAPEEFHGVEAGRVRRKPDDLAAWMSGEPTAHELGLVGAPAIQSRTKGPRT